METDSKEYLYKVGKNIKKYRLAKKVKQIALADHCDFKKQSLYKIEAGEVNLTLKTLLKIADALGVTVNDLITFDK